MGVDWTKLLAPAIVVALVFGLYLPSLDNPLVWDDTTHIERARDAPLSALFERAPGEEHFRPLVLLSYRVQLALGADHASPYHSFNIVFHALNAVLLIVLILGLGLSLEFATAASILFAVHPLQSAAVAYVSGRPDILALTFTLTTILCVLRARNSSRPTMWAVAAAVAAVAAPLSKEVGLVAPLLGAAACRVTLKDDDDQASGLVIPISMALVGLFTLWLVFPPMIAQGAHLSFSVRLHAMGTALVTYVSLLAWPTDLHLDRLTPVGGATAKALGLLVFGAYVPALLWFFRTGSVWAFALAAAALAYGPASCFIPAYPQNAEDYIFTPEHFMYVPLAAIAPLAVGVVYEAVRRVIGGETLAKVSGRLLVFVTAVLTAAAVMPVRARQADLSSEEGLYRSILTYSPSPRACFNLGVALLERGDHDDAVDVYARCVARHPNDSGMVSQLGVAYQLAGNFAGARTAYLDALRLAPDVPSSLSNLASLDASQGLYENARAGWERAIELDPTYVPAIEGLRELATLEERDR